MENSKDITRINIKDLIDSPYQGRLFGIDDEITPEETEKITELADSIRENGLMQPIIVRPAKNDKYEIVDGHRRVIAYKALGYGQIKAIVKDYNDKQAQVFNIIGNLQRKGLHNIELALAYQRALDSKLFNDQRNLANSLGIDETYVGDLLNMLRMDKRVIDDLLRTRSINDVRILRMIRLEAPIDNEGNSDEQWELYKHIRYNKLSRSQVTTLIKNRKIERNKEQETHKPKFEIKNSKQTVNIKLKLDGLSSGEKLKIQKLIDKRLQKLQEDIENIIE